MAETFCNKNRRGVWVPAFAGTTIVTIVMSADYRGAMRMAPSRRMVSPFSIGFSTM